MVVEQLTEHHLEFLSLKVGYRGSSESTHVKMSHCWRSHALAHLLFILRGSFFMFVESGCISTNIEFTVP